MTRTIDLSGKPQEVNVQRTYRSVWIAVGEYKGERIEVRDRSEADVIAAWQRAAKSTSYRRARVR